MRSSVSPGGGRSYAEPSLALLRRLDGPWRAGDGGRETWRTRLLEASTLRVSSGDWPVCLRPTVAVMAATMERIKAMLEEGPVLCRVSLDSWILKG